MADGDELADRDGAHKDGAGGDHRPAFSSRRADIAPVTQPPPDRSARARATYDRAHLVLKQWCDQLQLMLLAARGMEDGPAFNPAAGSKEARELVLALKGALEAEQKFNDLYASLHPEPEDDGFDLEAARLEIGCRIARIRECCREDGLPGEPDEG